MKHGTLFVIAAGSILAAALSRAEAQTAAPGTAPSAQAQPAAPGTAPGTQAAQAQAGAGFQQPSQGRWQNGQRGRFDQRDQPNNGRDRRDDWQRDRDNWRRDHRDDFADDRGEQHRGEWQDVRQQGSDPINHIAPTAIAGTGSNTSGKVAANLAAAEHDVATDRADIRADRRDIRQDELSLRTDQRDLRHDYAEQRAGDNDQAAIRQERSDIRGQARDIQQDEASLRATQQNLRTESQDVREDRADLRSDSGDTHGQWRDAGEPMTADRFGQNYARDNGDNNGRNDMQWTDRNGQSGWHSQGLTPTTLARNSADDKKSPTTRNLHQAWYHSFW
jgi:hypothetical protein